MVLSAGKPPCPSNSPFWGGGGRILVLFYFFGGGGGGRGVGCGSANFILMGVGIFLNRGAWLV